MKSIADNIATLTSPPVYVDQTLANQDWAVRVWSTTMAGVFRNPWLMVISVLDPLTKITLISVVGNILIIVLLCATIVLLIRGDLFHIFRRRVTVDAACSAILFPQETKKAEAEAEEDEDEVVSARTLLPTLELIGVRERSTKAELIRWLDSEAPPGAMKNSRNELIDLVLRSKRAAAAAMLPLPQ